MKTSRRIVVVAIVTLAASAVSCLDYAPIAYVSAAEPSVTSELAANACYQCGAGLTESGPSCGAAYAACASTPKCLSLFLCGVSRGCYQAAKDVTVCFSACALVAGLSSGDDPAVRPFLALYDCATTSCPIPCGAGEVAGPTNADGGTCAPPLGASCPPTAGNCQGIGKPCTKGGGECESVGKLCATDIDPTVPSICVSILSCTPGTCGTGATCCKTPMTEAIAVCLPNQCLPADCTADP